MHPSAWLEEAFGSEARVRILRLLVSQPDRIRSEREIASAIGMSSNAVNKAVRSLRDSGFLAVERVGNSHAVRLANESAIVEALRGVFQAEDHVWQETRAIIRENLPRDVACYLFGSTARHSAHAESDVDLLIVGRNRKSANDVAYEIQRKVLDRVPARLSVIAMGANEAARRLKKREGVVREAVAHGDLISRKGIEELVRA
jgi:predicted nucleotidyltransferase/biotin operon repressor